MLDAAQIPRPLTCALQPARMHHGGKHKATFAELHVIGEIVGASRFDYPELFCRWQLVYEPSKSWTLLRGLQQVRPGCSLNMHAWASGCLPPLHTWFLAAERGLPGPCCCCCCQANPFLHGCTAAAAESIYCRHRRPCGIDCTRRSSLHCTRGMGVTMPLPVRLLRCAGRHTRVQQRRGRGGHGGVGAPH